MTIQLRQRKFMLRQGFSAECQHQEEFVVTKKLLSRQMKQVERRNSVATRDLLLRHRLLQHEKLVETEEELQRNTSVATR